MSCTLCSTNRSDIESVHRNNDLRETSLTARARQILEPRIASVVKKFAPLGWAIHGRWHYEKSLELAAKLNEGVSSAAIDDEIAAIWNNELEVFLRNVAAPLGRYGKDIDKDFQKMQQQRVRLIDEAYKCHKAGHYSAAILLTYSQIDGLTRDVTGASFFSNSNNDRFIDDESLAGIEENLPVVRKQFNEQINETGYHAKLSRHSAVHGRDLSFGTLVNSTKAFVLLGALIEYLPERAKKAAEKRQRQHTKRARSQKGIDENGRLFDDRALDALLNFLHETNSHITSTFLFSKLDSESLKPEIYRNLASRRLGRDRFQIHGLGPTSVWWSYQVPAGHILGAAIRKWREGEKKTPDVWLWDSEERPHSAPWERADGWTIYDPNRGGTPNWAFDF